MIRVVLVDDEALVRAGVRAILDSDPEIEVVGEAGDGRTAIDVVRAHRPDVVLMDIRMPALDGIAATGEIVRAVPGTGVLILTTFSDDHYIAAALELGASGFLLKTGDPRELLAAVHAVKAGGAYLSPNVAKRVISAYGTTRPGSRASRAMAAKNRVEGLSDRELEVLSLIGAGLSNAEIAERLHVVEGTVKAYASALFKHLGVRNRVEVAIIAHHADLVDESP
ncbi:response regulator [Goodfellowiella coeruleoviolacea]|uniref:Two component transcriptional regulator, LuxR family n=1 Tax=Goodfellowiella coeruleoviolacea TaxID=334858 RepID=A0AAE3GFC1_9PSEU|nr:response regulator transcription factor [Goodfellowiella coeruleoviolacea]MCP2167080.1 two component transcriptional regulator, LuxR family [Goodfellowiella coeruleoviolacea]